MEENSCDSNSSSVESTSRSGASTSNRQFQDKGPDRKHGTKRKHDEPASAIPVSNGMDLSSTTGTIMNGLSPYMMNIPTDPYGMMGGMGNFCTYPYMNGHENLSVSIPVHEKTINLTTCVLYAPDPNAPPPTLNDRPDGCRTVFVGGLPEKITEESLREAFEQYGEIVTIRIFKKIFCHIRFGLEEHVEKALYLSGFQMKIENKDEPSYTGRLHVDYAVTIDDTREYNCARRIVQRLVRRKLQELEANDLSAPAIRGELDNPLNEFRVGNFKGGAQILESWVRTGKVSKENAGTFCFMMQRLNCHVQRLLNDKWKCGLKQRLNLAATENDWNVCNLITNEARRKKIELWKKGKFRGIEGGA